MRRAQRRSRLAVGHRRQAALGLDSHEHDARLDQVGTYGCILPGSWFFPRSARVVSRNLASGKLAPLCPERGQLDNERRIEELGVAKPRPGWDASPPVGGTRKLFGLSDGNHATAGMSPQQYWLRSLQTRCMTTTCWTIWQILARFGGR